MEKQNTEEMYDFMYLKHKQQRYGAMETGNHSNGASPKSLMSRGNFLMIGG